MSENKIPDVVIRMKGRVTKPVTEIPQAEEKQKQSEEQKDDPQHIDAKRDR